MSRSIERVLRGKMLNNDMYKKQRLDDYASNDEEVIDTILEILYEELPIEYKSNKNVDSLKYLFDELENYIIKADELNKKLINKKLIKLSDRIDRIIGERKKYIIDLEYELPILESYIDRIDEIIFTLENKENKKYELLRMLIDEQQMEHLEYTLNKYPGFVNLRNKDEVSLFRNVINRYLDSALRLDEENILFYSNLITFLQNQKSFNLTTTEKKLCLEDITRTLNGLSYNKKVSKKHKKEIYWINNLFTLIEPDLCKNKSNGSNKNELKTISEKYDINTDFLEEHIQAIKELNIPINADDYPDRRVVDDYIITIDGPDALEIDDGISCRKLPNGNYLLGVHIASVLGYFDYNSDIVQEAINRVNTIYLPKAVVPMFPFRFAGDIASLLPNENKLTRSYYFEVNNLGEVVNKSFEKTIIKSSKKANYSEINRVLEQGTINEELNDTITNLSELVRILENKYKASILYEEIKSKKNDPTDLKVNNKIGAEKLVYYSMMIVGEEVAKYFANNNYPCLYRTLEIDSNTTKQLETMVNNVTNTYGGRVYDKLYQLIGGIYPKAEYSVSGRHSGLDLDHYCHITSELRRAADIVVEHALEVCYDKVPTEDELIELEMEINRVSAIINSKSKKIEWFTNEYKTLTKNRRN